MHIRKTLILLLGINCIFSLPAYSDESQIGGEKILKQIIDFFENNKIMGRVIGSLDQDLKLDDGRISSDVKTTATYHHLEKTERGLRFHETYTFEQMIYDLDGEGNRITPGRNETRTMASLCEVIAVRSMVKVNGYCRSLANSKYDPTGWVYAIKDMRVEDGNLIIESESVVVGDCFASHGNVRPCASRAKSVLQLVNGKLQRAATTTKYDIDPDTMEWKFTEPRAGSKNPITYLDKEL